MTLEPAHGRVTITWPQPNGVVVPAWGLSVHDADTGEQLLDVTAMNIGHGSPDSWDGGPIHVTYADGKPSRMLVPTEGYLAWRSGDRVEPFAGQEFRTADFTYVVAEMRVAPVDPTVPTRESVNRGEHTINQYLEHIGLPGGWSIEEIVEAMSYADQPAETGA